MILYCIDVHKNEMAIALCLAQQNKIGMKWINNNNVLRMKKKIFIFTSTKTYLYVDYVTYIMLIWIQMFM